MTKETLAECFSLLKVMPHGSEQVWSDALVPLYSLVLKPLDDPIGKLAVEYAVLNEQWRPSPARLREIVAIVASPIPDAEQTYSELMHKAQKIGLHGKPYPDNPNVFLTGVPPMSHPIVSQIVAYLGGWEMICTGEAQMQEGLKKQVRNAHESASEQWRQEVKRQLALPAEQRNPVYFQPYVPYELPTKYMPEIERFEDKPKLLSSPEVTEMPAEVRKIIKTVSKNLPAIPKPKSLSAPPIYRRTLEAEVKAKSEEAAKRAEDPEYIKRRLDELA